MIRSKRRGAHALLLLAVLVHLLDGDAARAAEGYVGLQAGVHFWPAYSNRDQVEADTNPGFSWAVLGGANLGAQDLPHASRLRELLSPRLGLRLEAEVGQRFSLLHGVNDDMGQRTADGKRIQTTSAHLNVWPSWTIAERFSLYLGGGVGASWIRTLGSDKVRLSLQAGTGLLIELPIDSVPLRLDIGWRSYFASSAEYRDRLVDFNTHGANIGLHLGF